MSASESDRIAAEVLSASAARRPIAPSTADGISLRYRASISAAKRFSTSCRPALSATTAPSIE